MITLFRVASFRLGPAGHIIFPSLFEPILMPRIPFALFLFATVAAFSVGCSEPPNQVIDQSQFNQADIEAYNDEVGQAPSGDGV